MKKLAFYLVFIAGPVWAQNQGLTTSAKNFLSTLNENQHKTATYEFADSERFNWHFVPKSRNGIALKDLSGGQKRMALELLRKSLSTDGYQKTTSIMELENILRDLEGRGSEDKYRDPLNYYLTIFGTPDEKGAWGWRFEGHHVALNFSTVNNQIESSTPSFFGSNPAVVPEGREKGKQILKQEAELAFKLINALSDERRTKAIISDTALDEIVSFNSRKASPLVPAGLRFDEMDETQKSMLTDLLNVYVANYELGFSAKLMAKIKKAGMENLSFAWAGSLSQGNPYYYRIQGPMLLIELDNTQNNGNHVHSVVRDLTNDFGDDILREHYEKHHEK